MSALEHQSERILRRYSDSEVGQRIGWMAIQTDMSEAPFLYNIHLATATVSSSDAHVMARYEGERRVVSGDLTYGITAVRAVSATIEHSRKGRKNRYDVEFTSVFEGASATEQSLAFQTGASGDVLDADAMQWTELNDLFPQLREQAAGQPHERLVVPLYHRYNLSGRVPTDEHDDVILPDPAMHNETVGQADALKRYIASITMQVTALRSIRALAKNVVIPVAGIPNENTVQARAIETKLLETALRIQTVQESVASTIHASENFGLGNPSGTNINRYLARARALQAALEALSVREDAARRSEDGAKLSV